MAPTPASQDPEAQAPTSSIVVEKETTISAASSSLPRTLIPATSLDGDRRQTPSTMSRMRPFLVLVAALACFSCVLSLNIKGSYRHALNSVRDQGQFDALLCQVSDKSLHRVLHEHAKLYQHGVYREDRLAIQAIHEENPAVATKLVELARRQATNVTFTTTSSLPSSEATTTLPTAPVVVTTTSTESPTTSQPAVSPISASPPPTTASASPPAETTVPAASPSASAVPSSRDTALPSSTNQNSLLQTTSPTPAQVATSTTPAGVATSTPTTSAAPVVVAPTSSSSSIAIRASTTTSSTSSIAVIRSTTSTSAPVVVASTTAIPSTTTTPITTTSNTITQASKSQEVIYTTTLPNGARSTVTYVTVIPANSVASTPGVTATGTPSLQNAGNRKGTNIASLGLLLGIWALLM